MNRRRAIQSLGGSLLLGLTAKARATVGALGRAVGSVGSGGGDPLSRPQLLSGDISTLLTYDGSFQAPASFINGGGAMSVNEESVTIGGTTYPAGTLMYLNGRYSYSGGTTNGIGCFTIPTTLDSGYTGAASIATSVVAPTLATDSNGVPLNSTLWNFGQSLSSTAAVVTGSVVYNGKLYVSAAPYYDSGCKATAWVTEGTPDLVNANWQTPNSATSAGGWNPRFFAGPLAIVPTEWQAHFGGPLYTTSGQGALSNLACLINGDGFSTFSPSGYTPAGGDVPLTECLLHSNGGVSGYQYSPNSLGHRSFSGPFPLSGPYQTYTLTAAPAQNATSATLSAPLYYFIGTGSISGSVLTITACSQNKPYVGMGIYGTGISSNTAIKSNGTVNADGTGTYNLSNSQTVASTTINGAFDSAPRGACMVTFNRVGGGTDQRICTLSWGDTAVPYQGTPLEPTWTPNGTQFPTMYGTAGQFEPLPHTSYTNQVTIAPMGDDLISDYDGEHGTGFFWPGSSTFACLRVHMYGMFGPATSSPCNPGGSGSNDTPIPPDTIHAYQRVQFHLYNAQDLLNVKNGSAQPYAPTPYAWVEFPNWTAIWSSGCAYEGQAQATGGAYYSPTTSKLYVTFNQSVSGGGSVVFVFSVGTKT